MEIDARLPKNERILLAAEHIFTRYGFERATLDAIIALADVGKGTVYKYFTNKEGLFYKLVADKNQPFVEDLQSAVAGAASFREKLVAFFEVMIKFYEKNHALWQILYFEKMGEQYGCTVKKVDGQYRVVPRYSQIEVPQEIQENILRYFNLIYVTYAILKEEIIIAEKQGLLKESHDIEMLTTNLFFGVAMGIFHYNSDIADKMTPQECADLIADRFLHGNGRV